MVGRLPQVSSAGNLWEKHREILHRLYIIEKKRLKLVKSIMEKEFGFSTTIT